MSNRWSFPSLLGRRSNQSASLSASQNGSQSTMKPNKSELQQIRDFLTSHHNSLIPGTISWMDMAIASQQSEMERIMREKEEKTRRFDALKSSIEHLRTVDPVKAMLPTPDYVHTLTGWRGWKVNGGKLSALGMRGVWEPKKATPSFCDKGGDPLWFAPGPKSHHLAPHASCNCGYWSFKSLDLLTEALSGYVDSVDVIGSVEIWGRVIECENGFRSGYAYPKELWLLKPDLDHLGWTYGVPIRKN